MTAIKTNFLFLSSFLLFLFLGQSCSSAKKYSAPWAGESFIPMAWNKNIDGKYISGNLSINFGSPTIYQDKLFQGNLEGEFRAYSLATGRTVWEVVEKSAISGRAVVYKRQVIYGSYQGRVYSRQVQTGELNYAIDLGSSIEEAPVLVKGRLIYHTRDHSILALDASSGKILWKYQRAVPYMTTLQNVSRPLHYRGKLFVGFADGTLAAFRLEDGHLLWEQSIAQGNKFVDVDMRPFLLQNRLYVASAADTLKVLNPKDGEILLDTKLYTNSSPVLFNENIIVAGIDGTIYVIDSNGETLFKKELSDKSITSLTRWGDRLVASTLDGRVHFLSSEGLKTNKVFSLGSEKSAIYGEIDASEQYLAFLSSRSRLYVFKK